MADEPKAVSGVTLTFSGPRGSTVVVSLMMNSLPEVPTNRPLEGQSHSILSICSE